MIEIHTCVLYVCVLLHCDIYRKTPNLMKSSHTPEEYWGDHDHNKAYTSKKLTKV